MKNQLIIIDGPINSGKSTISKAIATLLPKTIVIEMDHIRHFADCLPLFESIPFTIEDSSLIANNWLKRGFNVVVDYPMSMSDYELFISNIETKSISLHNFSLMPSLEVALTNRGNRELNEKEKTRIIEQYRERTKETLIGKPIDNSSRLAEDVAKQILSEIDDSLLRVNRHDRL